MVILRATRKVLRLLPHPKSDSGESDTALGDWYVNRVVVGRRPLLLFVSSRSLLPMLEPARDVKRLPEVFPELIAGRLRRLGVEASAIALELDAMQTVLVGRTRDRSVTGSMVDFAKALPYCLPQGGWETRDLRLVERQLEETPCRCSKPSQDVIWPREEASRLLEERL